uniref:OSJNBa0061C06.6 protein n=1 Tax=Oryza sativa subsp. japonica TaxID=39947 RepID=Q5JQV6_ORYSJ|nr:OSJNBa0061C06.6 [Oryza sativa Japonica Group]
MVLEAVLKAVPADLLPVLAVKEMTKDAWDAIKTMRVGVNRVRKSKAQELRKQFDAIEFKEGESVEEFSIRLSWLVNNLAVLGIQLEESKNSGPLVPRNRQSGEGSSGKKQASTTAAAVGKKKTEGAANGERGARDQGRDKCKNCGRLGHWEKDCRQPKKQAEAHAVQGEEEDDEPVLLMAHAVELAQPPPSPPPTEPFDLVEPKVFTLL